MPHPYIQIKGREWKSFLEMLKDRCIYLACQDGKSDDEVREIIRPLHQIIEESMPNIFVATAQDISEYIDFYQVSPTEGIYDEFKGIYFTGIVVSRYLIRAELTELNVLALRAVLYLLDKRLEKPYGIVRPHLTQRVEKAIRTNTIKEHFGLYGWYLIYKCLFNEAVDKAAEAEAKAA